MSSLSLIRAGLVTNLNVLKTTYQDMQIVPYVLSSPTPPVIWVKPNPDGVTEYHQSFATMGSPGQFTWSMTVQAFVASGLDESAQIMLDELLNVDGAHSVKAAIEADKTLGGACEDLIVRRCSRYDEFVFAGTGGQMFGASWIVEVS